MRSDFTAILMARSAPPSEGALIAGPWQITLDAEPASVFCQPGLTAILKGQIYPPDLADLVRLYRQHGPDFPRYLEGSYSLLLVDETLGTVMAVTNRMGSHKLYAAHDGQRVTVSTLPDHPDFVRRPYHPAGLASLLSSGAVLNNLTLYEGVRSLEAASVHDIRPGGIQSRTYWQLLPPEGLDTRPEAELREEYAELLRRAVRRRVQGQNGPVHLSLSGGHDSRGLLSLLVEAGSEVRTFSYFQGEPQAHSDTRMADALAAQYGARHEQMRAYGGDLLATLRRNAMWGHGVTTFCDEVDAWATLGSQGVTDVFVGDEIHEIYPLRLRDISDVLARNHIVAFSSLGGLAGHLNPALRRGLEDAWNAELQCIRAAVCNADPYQQDFMLMARQHLPHSLLPWREHFAGRFASVHMPYLDSALAEFIHRLSPATLAGKRLFINALRELDPTIYRVPLAKSSGYVTDWHAELIRHRETIREELLSGSSRLDGVIDPQAIAVVLDGLTMKQEGGRSQLTSQVRRTLGALRRSAAGQRVFGRIRIKPSSVNPATWLLRVLTLRIVGLRIRESPEI